MFWHVIDVVIFRVNPLAVEKLHSFRDSNAVKKYFVAPESETEREKDILEAKAAKFLECIDDLLEILTAIYVQTLEKT